MTLAWMGYVLAFSLALAAVVYLAERAGALPSRQGRWMWAASIAASLAIPTACAWWSGQPIPTQAPGGGAVAAIPGNIDLSTRWVMPSPYGDGDSTLLFTDAVVQAIWFMVSIVVLIWWFKTHRHLRREARRWVSAELAGRRVLLSEQTGPAVVGTLRPRIVVPHWLCDMPRRQQRIVLAHEEQHIAAGDPWLLGAALALLVIVPWNLPLWFQVARLRRAIEVDCDARVVRQGIDVVEYGHVLLAIGSRGPAGLAFGHVVGLALSFLEQRIRIMLLPRHRDWRWLGFALAGLATGCVAVASTLAPPLPKRLSDEFVQAATGYYASAGGQYFIVAEGPTGLHLAAHGPTRRLMADGSNPVRFTLGSSDTTIVFDYRLGGGPARAFTWTDEGGTTRFERTHRAAIARMEDEAKERLVAGLAYPDGHAILRRNLELVPHGTLVKDDFSPGMLRALEPGLGASRGMAQIGKLGRLRGIHFLGVGSYANDFYLVEFEHGVAQFEMHMDATNKVSGLAWKLR